LRFGNSEVASRGKRGLASVVVIHINELNQLNADTSACLRNMASCKASIGGVLFVLPEDVSELSSENAKAFEKIQDGLAG
jgi:hypothetical protein